MSRRTREVAGILVFLVLATVLFEACGDKFSRVDTIQGFIKVIINTGSSSHEEMNLLSGIKKPGALFDDPSALAIPAAEKMIYADNGGPIYKTFVPTGNASATMSLPTSNPNYNFYILGYDSANLGGTPYCHYSPGHTLSGASYPLTLTPTQSNCNTVGEFNVVSAPATLTALKIRACQGTNNIGAAVVGDTCSTPLSMTAPADVSHIKIEWDEYPGGPGTTACFAAASGDLVTGGPTIPLSKVGIKVALFDGGCGVTFRAAFEFPFGMDQAGGDAKLTYDGTTAQLFVWRGP